MTANSPGEKNRRRAKQLRERLAYQDAIAALPAGSRCGNCAHRLKNPGCLVGLYCDLDSDFEGYAKTNEYAVCPRWNADS